MLSLQQQRTVAHVGPLALFLICMTVPDLMTLVGYDRTDLAQPWFVTAPEQWLFPVQTLFTLVLLVRFRSHYDFRPSFRGLGLATVVGSIGIIIWIAPGFLFRSLDMNNGVLRYVGFAERTNGFNPGLVATHSRLAYTAIVTIRFIRLVIVVPLAEEIFWRGFLMRYLVAADEDVWKVPFGHHHWWSFVIVTAMFTVAHSSIDYAPAILFGTLIYWLAIRTKSLSACVLAHAVANLILGVYVMKSEQWGYW